MYHKQKAHAFKSNFIHKALWEISSSGFSSNYLEKWMLLDYEDFYELDIP